MLALFFVTLFRNDDDKNEMDEDGDDKRELNEWNGSKEELDENGVFSNTNYAKQALPTLKKAQIEELKIKQAKRRKAKQLTREIVLNLIFLYVLFVACYSNRDDNAYSFGTKLKSTFKEFDQVDLFIYFKFYI